MPKICARETSHDPKGWTPQNPLHGQCVVVALLAHCLFGGTFLRASLENTPFSSMKSHYWNVFPDGTEYDFTGAQFGTTPLRIKGKPTNKSGKEITAEYLLKNEDTKKRFVKLLRNFLMEVGVESFIKSMRV